MSYRKSTTRPLICVGCRSSVSYSHNVDNARSHRIFLDGNIADNVTQTATDGVFTAVVTDDQNGALMRSARLGSILGVIALGFLLVV